MVRKRIDNTMLQFFEDFEEVCKTYGWRCTKVRHKKNSWENNIVKVKEIGKYASGHPKIYELVYTMPSIINPKGDIGTYHVVEVKIPEEYPSKLSEVRIDMQTKLVHPREHSGWMCVAVNGELDRVVMNLFSQLLWEDSLIWAIYDNKKSYRPRDGGILDAADVRKKLMLRMDEMYGVARPQPKRKMRILG